MSEEEKTSAEAWLYGQEKTKKNYKPEAFEKFWREQEKQESESVEE